MKIKDSTIITFPSEVGVEPGLFMFYNSIQEAAYYLGVNPRNIRRAIKNRTNDRHGFSWYIAKEVISDAKGMVEVGIHTQEWFDACFGNIENID